MPSTTRTSSERDDFSMAEDDDYSPGFSEDEIYYPVFCLTEAPNSYFDEFNKQAGENEIADVPWIEITTSDGPAVLDDLRQNASSGDPSPTPFKDWTVSQVYRFYDRYLRPDPNGAGTKHFTSFTFFIIDQESIQANPPQCIVCSDAPDFKESSDEIRLKTFRISIAEVMPSMAALEMLSMTPSEVRDRSNYCLKVHPQPMMVSNPDNPNTYQLATPAEGRANKQAGIRMAEGLELAGTSRSTEYLRSSASRRSYANVINTSASL